MTCAKNQGRQQGNTRLPRNQYLRDQRTIRKTIEISGLGLHTGEKVHLLCRPAASGTGIVFYRTDLPGKPSIPVDIAHTTHCLRCTTLAKGNAEIQTPEHLLSALYGLGIDNLAIEMSGREVPGLDGSARPFCEALQQAGLQDLAETRSRWSPAQAITVEEGNATLTALPYEYGLKITYHLNYELPFMPLQTFELLVDEISYCKQIAPARTFVLQREVEVLKKCGLGKGANTDNTLVIMDTGEVIANVLRFPDEFVRHKILDLIGDLVLLGQPLDAHVIAHKSGHAINARLVQQLAALSVSSK